MGENLLMRRMKHIACLVISAVAAALILPAQSVSADDQPPASLPVTIQLYPGWNLVGWLGEETTAGSLFESIESLEVVFVSRHVKRVGGVQWEEVLRKSDLTMQAGEALWLKLREDGQVSWTQQAFTEVDPLQLQPGLNAAVWAWRHDSWAARQYLAQRRWRRDLPEFSAWDAAATVLGSNLNAIWRWNA